VRSGTNTSLHDHPTRGTRTSDPVRRSAYDPVRLSSVRRVLRVTRTPGGIPERNPAPSHTLCGRGRHRGGHRFCAHQSWRSGPPRDHEPSFHGRLPDQAACSHAKETFMPPCLRNQNSSRRRARVFPFGESPRILRLPRVSHDENGMGSVKGDAVRRHRTLYSSWRLPTSRQSIRHVGAGVWSCVGHCVCSAVCSLQTRMSHPTDDPDRLDRTTSRSTSERRC
jgi:hypothetical protein